MGAPQGDARRDGAVLVYAQHLAKEVGKLLRVVFGGVLASRDVELAVLAEVYRSAEMVHSTLVVQPEDKHLAARDGTIAACGDAHDAVVDRGGGRRLARVVKVDEVIGGEI